MIINEMLIITKNGERKLKRLIHDDDKLKDLDNNDIIPNAETYFKYSFLSNSNYIIYNKSKNKFEHFTVDIVDKINLTFDNILFLNMPLEYRSSDNINKILYPLYSILSSNHTRLLLNISVKRRFHRLTPVKPNINGENGLVYMTTPKKFRHAILTTVDPSETKYIYNHYVPLYYNNHKHIGYVQTYTYGFFTISVDIEIELDSMQIRVLDKPEYYINDKEYDNPDEIIKILEELEKELTAKVVAKEFENNQRRYRLYYSQKDILNRIPSIIAMVEACETLVPDMIIQKLQR